MMAFEMFKGIVPAAFLVRLAKYRPVNLRFTMLKGCPRDQYLSSSRHLHESGVIQLSSCL
jgi:hypothetical protein